ncbi:transcriptional regulator [Sphingorhabdus lutea]|uniref:Transcriptional regulator n=1 Tax=Sphingorhabdus lutea TaxID=1913578 RepID=A0A1L3J8V2_9SPHN|nr:metalloregulator ArsR/SmtB family transcription factor [Sphingorhabdus lutea]APG61555.1 transcriptional regulator [Sphingorhabdus lutea]
MTFIYESRERADAATEKLKIYAQPQRLMILSFLLRGENSVAEIDAATEIGQPALSQQLAALRRADTVKTRREGKQIWYSLADEGVELCVKTMEIILTNETEAEHALKNMTHGQNIVDQNIPKHGTAAFAKIL